MPLPRPVLLAAAGALLALGCGGSRESAQDAGSSDGTSADAPPPPGSRAPWCPETAPKNGDPCTPATPPSGAANITACEYGSNPHCATLAECSGGTWGIGLPVASCSGNAPSCPAGLDAGDTAMCPVNEDCTYPTGRCGCISCVPSVCGPSCADRDSGTEWICQPWLEAPGCPAQRPLLGTACTDFQEGQFCGGGLWDNGEVCAGGYWWLPSGGC